MNAKPHLSPRPALAAGVGLLLAQLPLCALQQEAATPLSLEQGQTSLDGTFDWQEWRLEKRRDALEDTTFKFNLRTYYMDRDKFDDTVSEAWAAASVPG